MARRRFFKRKKKTPIDPTLPLAEQFRLLQQRINTAGPLPPMIFPEDEQIKFTNSQLRIITEWFCLKETGSDWLMMLTLPTHTINSVSKIFGIKKVKIRLLIQRLYEREQELYREQFNG